MFVTKQENRYIFFIKHLNNNMIMMIKQKFSLCLMFLGLSTSFTILFAQDTLLKARYISLPFGLISDEQVALTPADYAIWKSEIGELKQVYFTSFDIDFTANDSLATYQLLKRNTQNFANNFHDTTLLFQNGGKRITLNPKISAPYINKPIGSSFTFINDNELYVSKIIAKKQIADSVHARHILFTGMSVDKVEKILTDLKNNNITWEKANKSYSKDYVAAERGGDLGYFTQGMMVESFDKLCFDVAIVGEYYRVKTQFGEHIVQIIDKKFSDNASSLQTISYISPLILGKKTLKSIETKAQKRIGKSKNIDELEKKLRKEGIELEEFTPFQLQLSGEIAEWIKTAKNGDITTKAIKIHDDLTKRDKIMILGLKISNGSAISDEELTRQYGYYMLRKKKAELLFQSLKEYKSLEGIASKYNVEIKDIFLPFTEQLSSSDEMISDASLQNKLFNYEVNKLTEPIIGYNGYYIAYIFWKK
jgi:peptidyl-prolyl cis-trans isomerase D